MFLSLSILAMSVLSSAEATGAGHEACIVGSTELTSGVQQAYHQALQIETQKVGMAIQWRSFSNEDECGPDRPLLVISKAQLAHFRGESGERIPISLGEVDEDYRARTLATSVLGQLSKVHGDLKIPLLGAEEIALGPNSDPMDAIISLDAEVPTTRKLLSWELALGGDYLRLSQNKDAGGLGAEVALTLFERRLLFGLSGSFVWSRWEIREEDERDEDLDFYRVSLGESILSVRGGGVYRRWGLRGGLGIGVHQRRVRLELELDDEGKEKDWADNSTHGVVGVQGEVFVQLTKRWHVAVLVEPRLMWIADEEGPSVDPALGGFLRLGFNR